MIDDATLMAFIDGELSPAATAAVQAAAQDDPTVAATLDRHRRLASELRGAFETLLDAPVPEALASAVRQPARIVDLAAARAARQKSSPAPDRQLWGRIAATVVVAVSVGALVSQWRPPASHTSSVASPVAEQAGRLVATGGLRAVLDRQLASAAGAGSPTRVVLSFRNHDGAVCRSFVGAAVSGVACRAGAAWEVEGLFPGQGGGGRGGYRTASAGDGRSMSIVESLIDGAPFDAGQEMAARDAGWTRASGQKRP